MSNGITTGQSWTIAAAMLPFPPGDAHGNVAQEAAPEVWRREFATVAGCGFDAVDLTDTWVRPGDLSPARLSDLARAAADAGLGIPAISAVRRSVIDPEIGAENLAYSHRTIDAAAAISAPVVSIGLHRRLSSAQRAALFFWTVEGPSDKTDDDTWKLAVGRLRDLGRHATNVGVQLSLEMYEGTLLGTADQAVRLVEQVGSDNVGLNPDTGNLARVPGPIEHPLVTLEKTLPHANYWHVKNYLRLEDPAHGTYLAAPTSMELGLIDYRSALSIAADVGYSGALCVEHYGGDALSVMSTNRRYIESLLGTSL